MHYPIPSLDEDRQPSLTSLPAIMFVLHEHLLEPRVVAEGRVKGARSEKGHGEHTGPA